MPDRMTISYLFILVSGLMLAGCAATSAPNNWLPEADAAQYDGFGAWIKVNIIKANASADSDSTIMGELLSVEYDSLFILSIDNQLISVSRDNIRKARLAYYNSQHGALAVWGFVGALSTGSHGVGAIISLPIWILSSTAAAASQSRAPIVYYPPEEWSSLHQYARFPQGFPPQFDRSRLIKKPEKKQLHSF